MNPNRHNPAIAKITSDSWTCVLSRYVGANRKICPSKKSSILVSTVKKHLLCRVRLACVCAGTGQSWMACDTGCTAHMSGSGSNACAASSLTGCCRPCHTRHKAAGPKSGACAHRCLQQTVSLILVPGNQEINWVIQCLQLVVLEVFLLIRSTKGNCQILSLPLRGTNITVLYRIANREK